MFTLDYKNHKKQEANVSYFDSVNEYVTYLETTPAYSSNRSRSSKTGSNDFTGTKSWEEAIELCKYGDEKLRKQIVNTIATVDDVQNFVNTARQEYVNDVVGFMPNVPNHVMGVPTAMIRSTKKFIASKVLNIYVNVSASSYVSSKDIETNASKCVAAINYLEKQGYRCNVWSGDFGEKNGKVIGKIVRIKHDKEPLNLASMAFPMAHPSMLRRLSFKHIETMRIDFTHDGYGRPLDDPEELKLYFKHILHIDKVTVFSVSKKGGSVEEIMDSFKA